MNKPTETLLMLLFIPIILITAILFIPINIIEWWLE